MNKIKEVAQKLVAMSLAVLPLAALADVAFEPMSREEWERHRQFARVISVDMPQTSPAGYVIALLMGVFLSVCVVALAKQCSHRGESWRNFASKASMEWVILTGLILSCCLCVEVVFCPCSTFLTMVNGKAVEHHEHSRLHEESYEEYVFHETHCGKCGSSLDRKGSCRICCRPKPKGTEACPYCHGTGLESRERLCDHCGGWGKGSFPERGNTSAAKFSDAAATSYDASGK